MATEVKTETAPRQEAPTAPGWFGIGAVLAAVGASLCCVGPFVLVLLGLGGSWMSALVALAPYRPFFIVLTLAALGGGFYRLYLRPCGDGKTCALPPVRRRQRLVFWVLSGAVLALIAFPWYAPWFLD